MKEEHSQKNNHLDEEIYQQLKSIAGQLMTQERRGHTLSPTDLVHEAYLKISDSEIAKEDDQAYLFILARQMRRLLVDYGRRKSTAKHGGNLNQVIFTEGLTVADNQFFDFALISAAIDELETVSERSAKIIELYYFTGISREKTADTLNISLSTLAREVHFAKAYIGDFLEQSALS